MQFCHWCSKKISQGRFCGSECLQAAAEMPDLINHQPIRTPVKIASRRRTLLGFIGAAALIGGTVAAIWPVAQEQVEQPAPIGCVMQLPPAPPEPPTPEPLFVQTAMGPVSAFIFTNTTVAKTTEIDAMVQSTLPKLQSLYGNMALDTNNGAVPAGVLQLNFLIGFDGQVKWVSRTGIDFVPSLDSAAIKGLQALQFGESPVLTETITPFRGEANGIEVKVIYRFGDGNNTQNNQRDEMPYFQNVNR